MKKIFHIIALVFLLNTGVQAQTERQPAQRSVQTLNRAVEFSYTNNKEDTIDESRLIKKAISQEITLPRALDIIIDQRRNLSIKTWNENKVKIETTVQLETESQLTDEQWLEKLGINLKLFGSTVRLKSTTESFFPIPGVTVTSGNVFRSTPRQWSNSGVYKGTGELRGTIKGDRLVTLYIPAQSALEIDNKNCVLKIEANIKSLIMENTYGNIDAMNIDKLYIRSTQGSFTAGTIADGDIELSNTRLTLKNLAKGSLTSKYATIEIETTGDLKLTSNNDEIDIDDAGSVSGLKNYGSLRINQLQKSLQIEGLNSDIKLRTINSSVDQIKIFNRNADLRLPIRELKDYMVEIKGSYNNLYAPFTDLLSSDTLTAAEMKEITEKTSLLNSKSAATRTVTGYGNYAGGGGISYSAPITEKLVTVLNTSGPANNKNNFKYTAKVGTGNKFTRFEIACASCVLDFK
jgi:hypothetical protein